MWRAGARHFMSFSLSPNSPCRNQKREKGFDSIPIIAMTAYTMKGDREKFLEAGMNDYIPKPIKKDVVFGVIDKWVVVNE